MIYHELLLCITVIALILAQANADPGDPLNPSQLGESMSMPLSQELLQDARNAGVITGSNPINKPDSQQPSFSVVPQPEADAVNSIDNVNVTGTWTLDLKGTIPEKMKLYLFQNKDVVIGQGVITSGNGTQKATACGSVSGDKMSLTIIPVDVLNLYKLSLSLSNLSEGIFTAYMTDGSSRSGEVTFAVSSNIFKPASAVSEDEPSAHATTDSTDAATPVQLSGAQGLGRSISSKTSTSMSSAGGSMSQVSSSSTF